MKWFNKCVSIGLAVVFSMATTVFADEAVMDVAPWAIGTLNEGEKYGIYPIDWYYGAFQGPIAEEQLKVLIANVADKIGTMGFTVDPTKADEELTWGVTREHVIRQLYSTLARYQEVEEVDAVAYFVNAGLVVGTGEGLELERACTVQEATILATNFIQHVFDTFDKGAKGFAWQVAHKDNTMYLLGSIHQGNTDMYPINSALREAFDTSDVLLVEANLFNQNEQMQAYIEKAMYQDGTTLKDHISQETYEKVAQAGAKVGLPIEVLDQFKVWSVAKDLSTIATSQDQSIEDATQATTQGVDMYFLLRSAVAGKPVEELEGLLFQAQLFEDLTAEYKEAYLNSVVELILAEESSEAQEALEREKALVDAWQADWIEGDITGFTASYKEEIVASEEDEIVQMLFGERDAAMAEKLSEMLEAEGENTYFVVVGAGHFVEDETILYHFKDKGYDVELFYK